MNVLETTFLVHPILRRIIRKCKEGDFCCLKLRIGSIFTTVSVFTIATAFLFRNSYG